MIYIVMLVVNIVLDYLLLPASFDSRFSILDSLDEERTNKQSTRTYIGGSEVRNPPENALLERERPYGCHIVDFRVQLELKKKKKLQVIHVY